jgi:hypothetical protein
MRLKTENEEVIRAYKKNQMIEPKGAAGDTYNSTMDETAPALTSALARVRARRTTAQGSVPPALLLAESGRHCEASSEAI